MIHHISKKNYFYKSVDDAERNYWLDIRKECVINNVDTFYYTVLVHNDWNFDERCRAFVEDLQKKYNRLVTDQLEYVVYDEFFVGADFVMNGMSFEFYKFDIEKKDSFIIFFANKVPRSETPSIFVQIRSQYLWLHGEKKAFEMSLNALKVILEGWQIEIKKVQTNRFDEANHTNLIQNPVKFFKSEKINSMQVSNFERWHQEGYFFGDDDIYMDYFTLGRKKSNNVFFRIYDKTQEVCNKGYKQFFIKLWLFNGLINRYDSYCLEKCFLKADYKYMDKARLEFYSEFGTRDLFRKVCRKILDGEIKDVKKKRNLELCIRIRKLVNKLLPPVTVICNIEYQTKRKLFYTIKYIGDLNTYNHITQDVDQVFNNRKIIHELLTSAILRFVDRKKKTKDGEKFTRKRNCDTAYWWKRVQDVKIDINVNSEQVEILREYQNNLDKLSVKKRILHSQATFSLYNKELNNDKISDDILDLMGDLNENDIEDYKTYKKKKARLLKNRLNSLNY
jgi:hypothetical protein